MGIIYKCTNKISGKHYIGITIRDLNIRKAEHFKELRNLLKKGIWQEEYNKYGKESFEFNILEECPDIELHKKEYNYIQQYNCMEPLGYNKKLSSNGYIKSLEQHIKDSPYTLNTLINIVRLAIDREYKSVSYISLTNNVMEDTVRDILRLKSFKWLEDIIPSEYEELANIYIQGIERRTFFDKEKIIKAALMIEEGEHTREYISRFCNLSIGQIDEIKKGRSFKWLSKYIPITYTNITKKSVRVTYIKDTLTKDIYCSSKNSELARMLDIDHRRISDLISGKLSSLKNGRYILHKVE